MARALYITHKEVFPVTGGDQVRFSQILGMLADRFDVDLLALTHNRDAAPQQAYGDRLRRADVLFVPKAKRYLRAARTFFNRLPEVVNHYRDPRIAAIVRDTAAGYDVIVCGSTAMAQYAPPGHSNVLLDMTDSLAMNYRNAAARHSGLRRAWLNEEARRMLAFERCCRDRFAKVAYISDVDRRYAGYRNEKSVIVGNFVDLPSESDCCAYSAASRDIVFVGRMDYQPNILAVTHFAGLWRERLHRVAGSFRIVGGYAPEQVRRLAGGGIRVEGFVPALSTVFRDAALVVAPMLSGSGIQNKILQAMAHGCCVLTTPIGAEGLDVGSGAFAVAAPGGSFADAADGLMADPGLRRDIGARGRSYVAQNFSREAINRQFDIFIG